MVRRKTDATGGQFVQCRQRSEVEIGKSRQCESLSTRGNLRLALPLRGAPTRVAGSFPYFDRPSRPGDRGRGISNGLVGDVISQKAVWGQRVGTGPKTATTRADGPDGQRGTLPTRFGTTISPWTFCSTRRCSPGLVGQRKNSSRKAAAAPPLRACQYELTGHSDPSSSCGVRQPHAMNESCGVSGGGGTAKLNSK
jgi:hypothetical protein